METVFIALIAAVIGPGVMAIIANILMQSTKRQDWARQDAVAAAALKAAADITAAAISTKEVFQQTDKKLDVIHKLTNSAYTAVLKTALDSTLRELALLEEIASLTILQKRPPSVTTTNAIATTKARIADLEMEIAERESGAAAADPLGVLSNQVISPITQAKQTVTEAEATVEALKPEQ